MNVLRTLERRYGGWWTGIKFHHNFDLIENLDASPMRFCEAVTRSRIRPMTLNKSLLNCTGGSHCMGWGPDDRETARHIALDLGVPEREMVPIVESIPTLGHGLKGVTVGTYEDADIAVSFAQPENVMRLVRHWQLVFDIQLTARLSSFMGICGGVAVGAHVKQEMCFSFGCPHARTHAKIGRDRLIVGLPIAMIAKLLGNQAIDVPDHKQKTPVAAVS